MVDEMAGDHTSLGATTDRRRYRNPQPDIRPSSRESHQSDSPIYQPGHSAYPDGCDGSLPDVVPFMRSVLKMCLKYAILLF